MNAALLPIERTTSVAALVTGDGLLSPVLSSALRTQNHNDVSYIKEFGCSHHKHVLYAHKCVVCSSPLEGALVTAVV